MKVVRGRGTAVLQWTEKASDSASQLDCFLVYTRVVVISDRKRKPLQVLEQLRVALDSRDIPVQPA